MRFLLLLLALASTWASAQTATLTGRVLGDAGEPLPGANVFLSGTTRGAAASADGTFAFTSDVLGDVEVVASLLGYATRVEAATLAPGDTLRLTLTLAPETAALGEVRVEGRVSRQWHADLARFETTFFGASRNGRRARIENPEVLDFERRGETLVATARAPLMVLNRRLGYRMTLLDLEFEAGEGAWGWKSPLRYTPLDGTPSRGVRRERRRAYRGSLRHFLTALVAGRVREEGFQVRAPARPGRRSDVSPLTPESLAKLVTPDPATDTYRITSAVPLQLTYLDEADPRPVGDGLARGDAASQLSWLVFDALSARVDATGRVVDATPITRYGYLDWERVADLLPADYTPDA